MAPVSGSLSKSDEIWDFQNICNKGCRCKRGYCMAASWFNIKWKVPSVFDCRININISFSRFPFPKIPRPWWKQELLNQHFKENTFAPPADNEGQWRQQLYLWLCDWSPVWAYIYISVNRVVTHLFEWPCKVSNPCFTMNKYINNEISSACSHSLWKKEEKRLVCD